MNVADDLEPLPADDDSDVDIAANDIPFVDKSVNGNPSPSTAAKDTTKLDAATNSNPDHDTIVADDLDQDTTDDDDDKDDSDGDVDPAADPASDDKPKSDTVDHTKDNTNSSKENINTNKETMSQSPGAANPTKEDVTLYTNIATLIQEPVSTDIKIKTHSSSLDIPYGGIINPFRVLGFYKDLNTDLYLAPVYKRLKSYFDGVQYGMKINPYYCDYSDLFNMYNISNVFDHMNFAAEYPIDGK